MKKNIPLWIVSIVASLVLSAGLMAQEQTEVTVKVTKDGKVVKDTTYLFDDADEAKHAMQMMDLMSGDEPHMEHVTYNYTTTHAGSGHSKAMVFISEDGETTEITEFLGDSAVWVTEEEIDGEHVKVMKYKVDGGEHAHGEKVIVMKSGDGNTIDILVDEDSEVGDVVMKKEVRVVVSGDEEGNWTVVEGDEKMMDKDENVKVIVIKKSGDVHMDLHEDHDEDHDVDHDEDTVHEEDIEVKVKKK